MRRLTLVAGIGFAAVACDDRTRVGHFDIYTPGRSLPDSHSRSSLYYGRRLLTERYGSSAIDPYDPDRILFAGDTEFNGPRDPCGTFLYDGKTDQRRQIAPWPDGLGELSWSPDGTCILLRGSAMPRVVDLVSGEKTELADAVSKDGKQLEMYAMQWSLDSLRVAVFVRGQPHRRDGVNITDWDLVEVRLKPLAAEYVATISGEFSSMWTEHDFSWVDGRLVAVSSGRRGPIVRKRLDALGWATTSPSSPKRPSAFPCFSRGRS